MASACVNNIQVSPYNFFMDCPPPYPHHAWLSPIISFSRDFPDEDSKVAGGKTVSPNEQVVEISGKDVGDFEFRLEDLATMLPADELFSNGKLVPLKLTTAHPAVDSTTSSAEIRSPETLISRRRAEASGTDPYLFSPKAPRCWSRWRDLLGLKKLQNIRAKQGDVQKTESYSFSWKNASMKKKLHNNSHPKQQDVQKTESMKQFLNRNSNSSSDSSMSLPLLLRDSNSESYSISSQLSLSSTSSSSSSSSSSSGPDHEDLPRLSLDSDKLNPPRVRTAKPPGRASCENIKQFSSKHPTKRRVGWSPTGRPSDSTTIPTRAVESPRMNSWGKIVFHSLERSSSSSSSFNSGPRIKHRGIGRSYSANVRVTPVLNVPVYSLRGSSKSGSVFGGLGPLFSSPHTRDIATTRNRI